MLDLLPYQEIWSVDFEYQQPDGERPTPVCAVGRELRSGRTIRLWQDELRRMPRPPYSTGAESLFVAYSAAAEFTCHLALGWPMPARVLDLYVEFLLSTSGLGAGFKHNMLAALAAHGLSAMSKEEKASKRELVMRGGPWSSAERKEVLDYCEEDVASVERLMPAMLPEILARTDDRMLSLGQALLRGRFMSAIARMQWAGTPIDTEMHSRLVANWKQIQELLIRAIDPEEEIFEGVHFRENRFEAWLQTRGIPWPRLASGRLHLEDQVFRDQAKAWPAVSPIRELCYTKDKLKTLGLVVGSDGRNRCSLFPFSSKSGRNQPSNSQFIFGPSVWLRGLIKPPPGYGLAYIDWSAQEPAIAAILSGDPRLLEAVQSGDIYLGFAKQAGLAPAEATKASHGAIRDLCKTCVLGIGYGMEARTLSVRIGKPVAFARELLEAHHRLYARFWEWNQSNITMAMLDGQLTSVFGWTSRLSPSNHNPRSFQNFPMQANGAEMMRLACSRATEAGLEICAPVHDALLLAAPLDRLDEDIARLRAFMAEASRVVLDGFEVPTDVKQIRYPARYMDGRGREMWERIMGLLEAVEMRKAG